MQQFSIKQIISSIIIIASGLVLFLYTKPQYDQVQELKNDLVQFEQTLKEAKDLQSKWAEILTNYSKLSQDDIDKLVKLVPDNIDNIKLILEVNELVAQHGLKLKNIEVTDTEKKGEKAATQSTKSNPLYGQVNIDFSFKGPYEKYLSFVARLERSLRIIDITKITFKAPKDEKKINEYDFELTLSTYWLRK